MKRTTLLLQAHALVSDFVGGVLGFGFATLVVSGADGGATGILTAALILTALGKVLDVVLTSAASVKPSEDSTIDTAFLFFITATLGLVLVTPVAALLAPNYALHGFLANVVAIAFVQVAAYLVGRASPWGTRYRPDVDEAR